MGKVVFYGGGMNGVPVDEMTNPAAASDVYYGETFATQGNDELITGSVQDKTTNHTQTLNETWTIPAGYHDGTGKVTQNLTYIGAQTGTISTNGSATIKTGYHNGKGKITANNSLYTGGAVYPGTSNKTLSTKGKVLSSKLYIPAQSNLTSANIVKGKSLFGVSGSFDTVATMARDQQVYNGSQFMGWLNGGFITRAKPIDHHSYFTSYYYGYFNDASAYNTYITSGALYCNYFPQYSSGPGDLPGVMVSAKTLNFSQFSSVRFTGYWSCGANAFNGYYNAEVSPGIGIEAVTKSGDTVTEVASNKTGGSCGSWSWKSSKYEEDYGSSGNVSFDVRCDISNITSTSAYMLVSVGFGIYEQNSHVSVTNPYFKITGIWLYV